jgi:hypothetical protein
MSLRDYYRELEKQDIIHLMEDVLLFVIFNLIKQPQFYGPIYNKLIKRLTKLGKQNLLKIMLTKSFLKILLIH